jgi:23S rRNA pseudouridine1911/1915/1917 synthase
MQQASYSLGMSTKTVTVPNSIPFPARQLAAVLQNLLSIPASHSAWLVDNGCVQVNARMCRKSHHRLEPGDVIQVDLIPMPVSSPARKSRSDPRGSIEFLYDDESLCVVNKPAGLLTVPTRYGERQTLLSRVERRLQQSDSAASAFVVHRLDRDVSGVLVIAKSLEMAEAIRSQFAARKPERTYVALVAGIPSPPAGRIESYLATDSDLNRIIVDDASQGELAITHYSTRNSWQDSAMVEVRLETGRRNQIRVHLAELGYPILGDPRYRREQATHRAWPHGRVALHAESLGFTHPVTGEKIHIQSQWPQEFRDFIRAVGKRRSSRDSHE